MNPADGRMEARLILRLAAADLAHEWVLSACLVLALAAVIAPLLLIFGLKFGTVETLRIRLIQNPVNREVRPTATVSRERGWFDTVRGWPQVGFLVPTTRQIAASVTLDSLAPGGRGHAEADLVPTAAGDRLLLENGVPIPGRGEIVLTAPVAQALDVRAGDHVRASATRSRGSASERAVVEWRVAGELPVRASGLRAVYAPLDFLEAVEAYKDGLAVPAYGWEGTLPVARPEYDGAVVLLPGKLGDERKLRLVNNTGFSRVEELDPAGLLRAASWTVKPGGAIYLLSTESSAVGEDSLRAVADQLRGQHAEILPWVRPVETVFAVGPAGTLAPRHLRVQGLSVAPAKAAALGLAPVPPWGEDAGGNTLQILWPDGPAGKGTVGLAGGQDARPALALPVEAVAGTAGLGGDLALAPSALAGLLRLARDRRLRYDPGSGQVLLERRNYSGFRLYARTIDDVEPLRQRLAAENITVHTEAQRIGEVTELDRQLTRIFWLIAAVGMIGGVAALVASLYAAVERKRRELGVLRLVGIPLWLLVRFPVYQGLLLGGGGFVLAAALFAGIAAVINTLFRGQLGPGESFCRLPVLDQLGALGGVLLCTAGAALLAAGRVRRITPAEALRDV